MALEQRELGYMTGACITHGTVVGVVAVLAGGPYVAPAASILMGGTASAVCYYGRRITKLPWLRVDDTFEAFGFYYLAGVVSLLLTGVFAYYFGAEGMVKGDELQPWRQFIGICAVTLWSGGMTFLLAVLVSIFAKIRTTPEVCALMRGRRGLFQSPRPSPRPILRHTPHNPRRRRRRGWTLPSTNRR